MSSKLRSIRVKHVYVSTALSRSGLPDIDFALNPYLGCSHGCIYCYARLYTRDREVAENWGSIVGIKMNLPLVLMREVRGSKPGVVGVGTITDSYQPTEAIYGVTKRCLEILLKRGFNVSIQTKNPLVLRDITLLASRRELVDVGFTITSLNESVRRLLEPKAPPYKARVHALDKLRSVGVKTWVFYGPVVPGINDDEESVRDVVEVAAFTSSTLYYDPLHVKSFMLNEHHPLYGSASKVNSAWWRSIVEKILYYCKKYGVTCKPGFTGDASRLDAPSL